MHLTNIILLLSLFYPNNQLLAHLIYPGSETDVDVVEFYSPSIRRGISDDVIGKELTNLYDENRKSCKFVGKLNMGGAFSLGQEDKFRSISCAILAGKYLVVDYANCFRCDI